MRPCCRLLRLHKPVERNPANGPALEAALNHALRLVQDLGPCTTHTLHTALHKPASSPPPPQAPANTPPIKDPILRRRRQQTRATSPAPPEGQASQWSMAFLKRRVLAHLLTDGALVKVPRERWEHTAGEALPPQEKGKEGESAFVWVDTERWNEVVRRGAQGASQGLAGAPPKDRAPRGPQGGSVERELRKLRRKEGSAAPWSE